MSHYPIVAALALLLVFLYLATHAAPRSALAAVVGPVPARSGAPLGPDSRLRATFGVRPAVAVPAVLPPAGPLSGWATWYDDGPGLYGAAGPALRHGQWRGSRVTVSAGGRSVTVVLSDWCACGARGGVPTLIDLSSSAFRALVPLSQGAVRVRIDQTAVPAVPTGPPTDVGP